MDASEARARFASARVVRLATVTAAGRPHLVPSVCAVAGDTVYSAVDAKPKRTTALARLDNVAAHPQVCLLADHYAEDWSTLWWVRADGRGRVLELATSEAARATALLSARYPQQQVIGDVLAVDVSRWSGWSASDSA
jgi:PPOX class probable F420-dependent enzyme